jgi:hypothetical protein
VVNRTDVELAGGLLVPIDHREAPAPRADLVVYPSARSTELAAISEWEPVVDSPGSYRSYWSLSYEGEHGPEWETLYLEVGHSDDWDESFDEDGDGRQAVGGPDGDRDAPGGSCPGVSAREVAWEWSVSVSECNFEVGFAATLREAIAECEQAALELGDVCHD